MTIWTISDRRGEKTMSEADNEKRVRAFTDTAVIAHALEKA
jgi:hypothetical protein